MLVCDINAEAGEKVAATSDSLFFQKLDVTQRSDWERVVDQAISQFGHLDILVNNAGTSYINKVRRRIPHTQAHACAQLTQAEQQRRDRGRV